MAAELQRVLNSLLSGEVKDPRLVGVTISALDVSGDISVARVGYSTLNPDDDPAPVLEALESASGFLRARAGAALGMRRVPELRFEHDEGAQASSIFCAVSSINSDTVCCGAMRKCKGMTRTAAAPLAGSTIGTTRPMVSCGCRV